MIICPAYAMLRGPEEEVVVMAATLPPFWEVRGGLAELETLREQRVEQDLLSNAAEQLNAIQCARGTLLCYGVDDQGWICKF